MPVPSATPTIDLHLSNGTLFATPNGGNTRAPGATSLRWAASFPFRIEFATLTGGTAPPDGISCTSAGSGYEFLLTLPDAPATGDAPSYKYTIRGDGEATGRVLDPIIIVDKR